MHDRTVGASLADGHHNGVQDQLTMNGLPGGPPNDLPREQIKHYGDVKPTLPGADIGDISDPDAVTL